MGEGELADFRERWKRELGGEKDERRRPSPPLGSAASSSPGGSQSKCEHGSGVDEPGYVSIARGLLGGRTSPLLERLEEERNKRKQKYRDDTAACRESLQHPRRKVKKEEQLLDQLIVDLNETNEIPFFDMELPYELALKIFQYLNRSDLGRCAQVSRVWRILAEDQVLWFRLCAAEGFRRDAAISDSPSWKAALRDSRVEAAEMRGNWKNRIGRMSQLHFELGKVLCHVSSCDNYVLAGYSSGDVRLWDTRHWDLPSSYLLSNHLSALSQPRPHVTHVRVAGQVAAAAYRDGCVDVWSTRVGGEPIYHQRSAGVHAGLSLSPDGSVLASAVDRDVRLDGADEHGAWRPLSQTCLPQPVQSLLSLPGVGGRRALTAASAGDSVYLLDEETRGEPGTPLHSVYAQPVTCLDASERRLAVGVAHGGWALRDGGNKIHVYDVETGKALTRVGDASGDFTCVHLDDADAPHTLLCGNKDRRVRAFDLRSGSCVASLYAHHLGVTAVRGDDWKVVSGGGEGLVCVWEWRMGSKLWEMHHRHPVRYIRLDGRTLLTANVPDDKTPRGACITDDDLTAHRRHRGAICHYDFWEESRASDAVLPICRSDYDQSDGYNYNIALAVPYDRLR
ncbi:F-box/WD repeat-containing protein 8 [Stigmatopora nigra]